MMNCVLFSSIVRTLMIFSFLLTANVSMATTFCDDLANRISSQKLLDSQIKSGGEKCVNSPYYNAAVGNVYLEMKKFGDAQHFFKRAAALDNDYAINLAGAYFDQYLDEKDSSLLNKSDEIVGGVITASADNHEALRLKGMILYHKGLLDEAEKMLLASISKRPEAYTYEQLALVHFKKGCFSCVIGDLEQGSILEPAMLGVESFMYLGIAAYVELQQYDNAKNTLALLIQNNKSVIDSSRYKSAIKLIANLEGRQQK